VVLIGLTGGIGSGKSTVGRLLAERGAVVVDADELARAAVEPGLPAHHAVVARFGTGVLRPDGQIDRAALARVVFRDDAARADLEAIVHPSVWSAISERAEAQAGSDRVVVAEVPLLVETGSDRFDGVVVVDCPEELAVRRLVEQRGLDEDDAWRRVAAQAARAERRARAGFVVRNDGSLDRLRAEVEAAWSWIQGLG
jgi:dephospho-CoA kinase